MSATLSNNLRSFSFKIEGYDPINEIFFRDNTALGIRESATPVTDNLSAFVPILSSEKAVVMRGYFSLT